VSIEILAGGLDRTALVMFVRIAIMGHPFLRGQAGMTKRVLPASPLGALLPVRGATLDQSGHNFE
jgi:hypothetical protein